MRVPESALFRMNDMQFHGDDRPKHFFVIEVSSKSHDIRVQRYVRSWPVALRFRLWWHRRKAIMTYKKVLAFRSNHGL